MIYLKDFLVKEDPKLGRIFDRFLGQHFGRLLGRPLDRLLD